MVNHLSSLDVIVFSAYMLISVIIGISFTKQQKNLKSYLLADRNMNFVVVAISVIAALFSGISYLGAPTEGYNYGLVYLWALIAFFVATPITTIIFLPFFYSLKMFTAYEYLEKRFDLRIRRIASGFFIIRTLFWLAIATYAPALAINVVTGMPLWLAILLSGAVTTFYTVLGGMKAVIYTDVLQFAVLFGGILLVCVMAGLSTPGGFSGAWQLAAADGRTRFIELSLDPTVRMTTWAAFIGGIFNNLVQMVSDQVSVQRYLTASSLKEAQKALWFKLFVTVPMVAVFFLTGTVIYGYYKASPGGFPVLAKADQLLPYFVMDKLPSPIPGILIAAIFAATMSTVSAAINSLTSAVLMDWGKGSFRSGGGSDSRNVLIARTITACFGAATILLAFAVSKIQSLIEATNTVTGFFGGALLGVFFLAVFTRRANTTGCIIGILCGALATLLAQFVFHFSFMWLAAVGAMSTLITGYLSSLPFSPPGESACKMTYSRKNIGLLDRQ